MPHQFSHRLDWTLGPNRLSQALDQHKPRFDLTASNPTKAGIYYPPEAASALHQPEALIYNPDPCGIASARAALNLGPHTILSASTSEAYAWLFKLLANPSDNILVPRPSYPLFEFLAKLESVEVRQYSLRYSEGWWLDFESLKKQLNEKTRAILFVHPNNPTGSYLKQHELTQLTEICAQRDIALISDEVFAAYPLAVDGTRAVTLGDNRACLTFTLGGLSKSAGLPQMKAAWLTATGPAAEDAARRLELIADTYLSVSSPVQLALPALLQHGIAIQQQIQARTSANLKTLNRSSLRALNVEGGWYAILPAPRTRTEEDWALHLLEHEATLTQPGYFYDFETDGWLVISLLTPEADFASGIEAIHRAFTA